MATRKEIEVAFTGKDEGATSLTEKLVQKLRALKAEQRASGEKDLGRVIRGGPEAIFEKAGDLIGGARFGFTGLIIEQIAGAVEKAADLVKEFKEGKISAGEMTEKIAGSVPILGEVWKAGRAIRSIFDDTDAKWEEMNAAADEHFKKVTAAREAYEGFKAALKSVHDEIADEDQDKSPIATEDRKLADRIKKLAEARDKALNEEQGKGMEGTINDTYNKGVDEATRARNENVTKIMIAQNEKRKQLEEDGNKELTQARAKFEEQQLRDKGYNAEADTQQKVREINEQIAALDEEKKKRQKDDPRDQAKDIDARRKFLEEQKQYVQDQGEVDANAERADADEREAEEKKRQQAQFQIAAQGVSGQQVDNSFTGLLDSFRTSQIAVVPTEVKQTATHTETIAEQITVAARVLLSLQQDGIAVKGRTL